MFPNDILTSDCFRDNKIPSRKRSPIKFLCNKFQLDKFHKLRNPVSSCIVPISTAIQLWILLDIHIQLGRDIQFDFP
jgi:hypothetical protein